MNVSSKSGNENGLCYAALIIQCVYEWSSQRSDYKYIESRPEFLRSERMEITVADDTAQVADLEMMLCRPMSD